METLYDELEIVSDADQAAIKQAYRRMAQKHHPDKEGGDKDRMQRVQQAYDVLSDPDKRADYDATGTIPGAARTLLDDAITIASQAIEAAIVQASVEYTDILKYAASLVETAQKAVKAEKKSQQAKLDKHRKAMGRVSAVDGKRNSLDRIMRVMESKLMAPMAGYEHGESAMGLALDILRDHKYQVSERSEQDSAVDAGGYYSTLHSMLYKDFRF